MTDDIDPAITEAMAGPLVAAAPGHYLILADYHPAARVPVLAWRIGETLALPVLSHGTWEGESIIEYPDGIVREHIIGRNGREYENLAAYLAAREARGGLDFFEASKTHAELPADGLPF